MVAGTQGLNAILNYARWTSGLSRFPFTEKIMGSNPIRVTILRGGEDGFLGGLITQGRRFESCSRY